MDYLDFELHVETGEAGDYDVLARSPAGEARASTQFPYDELGLRNKLQALQIALLRSGGPNRRTGTPEDRDIEQLGRDLFDTLFRGEVAARLVASRGIAHGQHRGLRIKLRISAPELLSLPWEYLYDAGTDAYLALSAATPLVRYIPLAQPIDPLEVEPPLRILGLVAGPTDMEPLDADTERQRLEEALADLRDQGMVELHWVAGQTLEDFHDELMREQWHAFHFVGHGGFNRARGEGVVYLADESGKARELGASSLALLLGDHDPLRLAVLNSCDTAQGTQTDVFSSTAAALVKRGTPAVVAMQFQISDVAAIQFSRVFYTALTYGMPVDAAVSEARKSMALQVANTLEWGTPVLFMRSPDGVLFRVPEAEPAAAEAVATAAARPPMPVSAAPSAPAFDVVPTAPEVALDASRVGVVGWSVRNLTGKRLAVRAWPTPQLNAAAAWFELEGETERVFDVGASQEIQVRITVPADVPAGRHGVRLDVASAADPDDEWANGGTVAFDVAGAGRRIPDLPWRWIAAGGGALVLVVGAILFFLPPDDPVAVNCSGELTTERFGTLGIAQPSYLVTEPLCILRFDLSQSSPGSGTADVRVDGESVYAIDLDNFEAIGEPGAGSGERTDTLAEPIGVPADGALQLDLSSCEQCSGLSVTFAADASPGSPVAPTGPIILPIDIDIIRPSGGFEVAP